MLKIKECDDTIIKDLKEVGKIIVQTLIKIENNIQIFLPVDIESELLITFLNDTKNSVFLKDFKKFTISDNSFNFYGICLLISFRNCCIHNRHLDAFKYFFL